MIYISDAEVQSVLDVRSAYEQVQKALVSHAEGKTGLSEPRSLHLRSTSDGSFFHIKGGYLTDEQVAGFRLGGIPPRGANHPGMRFLMLSDLHSTLPLALIAEQTLYLLRAGAMISITIKQFRPSNSKTLAIVGAGQLARSSLISTQAIAPFSEIRIADVSAEQLQRFYHDMVDKCGAKLLLFEKPAEACFGADVIVTLTNAKQPIIKPDWCKPGNLLVTAGGGVECEEAVILDADRIFVDDWEQCTLLGDLAKLYKEGKLNASDIAGTISDVVTGRTQGRCSEDERIVAVPQGLTILDVALGNYVYQQAKLLGLGIDLGED